MAFNSKDYGWKHITLFIGGVEFVTIQNVEYGTKQEKEAQFAKGVDALFIGRGNKKVEGSIDLMQKEYRKLKAAANGDILDLVVDIVINYGELGDTIETDRVTSCEFTEDMMKGKQGDKALIVSLPFLGLKKI